MIKGEYFITSEDNFDLIGTRRLYAVRRINWETGDVTKRGNFQEFTSRADAVDYIKALLEVAKE